MGRWVGVPLENVGDGAGVHEQALGELQRHHLRIRLYETIAARDADTCESTHLDWTVDGRRVPL